MNPLNMFTLCQLNCNAVEAAVFIAISATALQLPTWNQILDFSLFKDVFISFNPSVLPYTK